MSSVLDVFQEYYPKLMRALPMNDEYFVAELYSKKLLPGNLKADIESLPTSAKRASKFLDDVIKPSVENNDCTKFHTLLRLMKENDDDTVKQLADTVIDLLNETIRNILNQRTDDDKTAIVIEQMNTSSNIIISSQSSHSIARLDIVSLVLEIISNHLRDMYKRTRFTPKGAEWPPNIPKLIVSVALIHYKGKRTQQELFEMASIHKEGSLAIDRFTSSSCQGSSAKKPRLDYSRVTKNITDIFAADPTDLTETGTSSTESPKRILIEGAPGIGKTVLAKEIAYQWATNEILTEIKIVFLLYLRDPRLQSITTTKQLVEYMSMGCLNDDQITTFNQYLVNSKGQQLCIVMDGFDEYPTSLQTNSFIVDIINGGVLPETIVVITSRPTSTVSLHDQVDRRIDILGLPKEERVKYISQTFSNSSERDALDKYLKQQPVINGLCFVPLHLAILLYLFQQGSLPETLTEMNESFILHTIYRHLKRYGQTTSGAVDKLAKVPKPILDIVYNLSELAFKGLQENKLVFTFDEIKYKCPSINETVGAINGFGLLQAVEHYPNKGAGTTTSFNFLHYTMQEYLAALHVSNLPSELQLSLMEKTFWDGHYNFMWMMFVGLVGINSNIFVSKVFVRENEVSMSKNILGDKRKLLHMFQCYMEAKSSTEAPDVISNMFKDGKVIINELKLLPHHISSLMTFMSRSSTQWKMLVLKDLMITDVGMNVLEQFIPENFSTLEYLDLSDNESSPWGLYCAYIRHCSCNSLTLSGDYGMKEYVNEINDSLQINTKMWSLKLENMTNEGGEVVFEIIRTNKTLQNLYLSNNNFSNEGTKMIGKAIKVNKTLQKLDISHNSISDDGVAAISDGLKYNTSLQELNMSHNKITSLGAKFIAEAIQVNRTLHTLDLYDYNIYDRLSFKSFDMTVLTAVYHNNTLMKLTLPRVSYYDKRLVSSEVEKINKERTRQGISTLTYDYTDGDSINYNISS